MITHIFQCSHCQARLDYVQKRTKEVRTISVGINPATGRCSDIEFSDELEAIVHVEFECPACGTVFDSIGEFKQIAEG